MYSNGDLHRARYLLQKHHAGEPVREEFLTFANQVLTDVPDLMDDPPAPAPAAVSESTTTTPTEEVMLGVLPDGSSLTAKGCEASGKTALEYLSAPGANLTAAGKRIRDGFAEIEKNDPVKVAESLGIDVAAFRSACAQNHKVVMRGTRPVFEPINFDEALRAEIAMRQAAARGTPTGKGGVRGL